MKRTRTEQPPVLSTQVQAAPDSQASVRSGAEPQVGTNISGAPDTVSTQRDSTPSLGTQIQPAPDGDVSIASGSDLLLMPMSGGAITVREKANLRMGQFSMVQNMRGQHPGFKQRSGQAKLHTTADGSNKVLSLHQFNKTKVNGEGYQFDGVTGKIVIAQDNNLDMGTNDFSIVMTLSSIDAGSQRLLDSRDATHGYTLNLDDSDGLLLEIKDGTNTDSFSGAASVLRNGLMHTVVASVDRSGNSVLYVDGSVISTDAVTAVLSIDSNIQTTIGIDSDGSSLLFAGSISRALLFNLALTATEVKALSSGAPVPYKYIGASQTELHDLSNAASDEGGEVNATTGIDVQNITITSVASDGGVNPDRGSYFLKLVDTGAASTAKFEKTAVIGKRYRFSFRYYVLSANAGTTTESSIGIYDTTGFRQGTSIALAPFTVEDAWTSVNIEFIAVTTLNVLTIIPVGETNDITYIDDMQYKQIGAVLQLEHTGVTVDKWWDSSGNELDGTRSGATAITIDETAEPHFLAQMSDGDILDATTPPPGITTGAFGSQVYSGSLNQIPGSWSIINDMLLHSNGVDQHQIYGGTLSAVSKFVVYKGSGVPPTVPTIGEDYSVQVTDGRFDTVAVLDSLNTFANNEVVFIGTPVPVNELRWRIEKPNGTVSTATLYYKKTDNTWSDTSMTDGTKTGGNTTIARNGAMTWTIPTDEQSSFMYGVSMFWYQLRVSAQLDAEVEVSGVTFAAPFQDLRNVWDGVPVDAVEVQVEGSTQYSRYAAGSVNLGAVAGGKKIVIASADPLEGIYIDCGSTPNATGTAVTSLKYWDGNSFAAVGTITDSTAGMSSPGWITFPRKTAYKHQFGTSTFYAYWYEIIWDTTISADTIVYIQTMPYFDIGDFGKVGVTSAVWQNRGIYTFDRNPEYIYISSSARPMVLNGYDFKIRETADGRPNTIVAMKNFYNELMVLQDEGGVDGGTLSILYGDAPSAKILMLSSRTGTFSQKSMDVVDGIRITESRRTANSDEREPEAKTIAFFISRLGVCACDGRKVIIISDDIQNYFDPEKTECIRRGYEKEMWLKYDSTDIVLRIGLVSGSSATVPNIFPVYDLIDGSWYFDDIEHELSCMSEVEAFSGDVNRIQVGGGVDDGFVYRMNTGTNDVSTAINAYIQPELDVGGLEFDLAELILRMKTQSAGDVIITPYINDQIQSTITLSMTAATGGDAVRRHRLFTSQVGDHISLKLQNSTVSQELYIESLRVKLDSLNDR